MHITEVPMPVTKNPQPNARESKMNMNIASGIIKQQSLLTRGAMFSQIS